LGAGKCHFASLPLRERVPEGRVRRPMLRNIFVALFVLLATPGLAAPVESFSSFIRNFEPKALAAGVTRVDLLAMLFAMGAFAGLLALVVWYLLQLRPRSSREP